MDKANLALKWDRVDILWEALSKAHLEKDDQIKVNNTTEKKNHANCNI